MEGREEQGERHGDAAMIVVYLGSSEVTRRIVAAAAQQREQAHIGEIEGSVVRVERCGL